MLFKYSAINDYFKDNLAEQQIWFSPPSAFNDIDDSHLLIDWRLTDEDILSELEFVLQQIYRTARTSEEFQFLAKNVALRFESMLADRAPDGTPDQSGLMRAQGEQALEMRRNTIGISCFSQDNLNKLLWAHYADSYRGVCMGIETDFDRKCFPQLEAVQYVDSLPRIKVVSHMRDNLIRLYITKHKDWSYEREIRAFQHVYGKHVMDPRCLANVFFGPRVKPDDAREIRDIVQRTYGQKVQVLQMTRGADGDLTFQDVPSLG